MRLTISLFILLTTFVVGNYAQQPRILSGTVVTYQFELVPNVEVEIKSPTGNTSTATDASGNFSVAVPHGPLTVTFAGKNIAPVTQNLTASEDISKLFVKIRYVVPPLTELVTISTDSVSGGIEFTNDAIYKKTLFARDDQLVQSLNAGISAGQHEGGGKSLEIRRYGFNLDHGGVGGGLKINIDNVQQNQATQGHGQGYLGALKSLSPELVDDVSIINGPFSAAYGDFSGLGVVQIRLRESLPDIFTARLHGGSFDSVRGFFAFSPAIRSGSAFFSYEPSYSNGPFKNPLRYRRDNFAANFTHNFNSRRALGIKGNFGRNRFTSSGQIPLDLVEAGELDRFGFIDPESGGKAKNGTVALYFRNEFLSGATIKADAFVTRSLFDLFSNFTFFVADPVYGDEIQQHDSRLQQGANLQYIRPYQIFGSAAILNAGASFNASQINVGLYPSVGRTPSRKFLPGNIANPGVLFTSAQADLNNYSAYAQNEISLFDGHLRVEAGLRFDQFTFKVDGFEQSDERLDLSGRETAGKFQPKASIAVSPFESFPLTFHANYGRGIASQDARGIIRNSDAPKISTVDFYQAGSAYNSRPFSFVVSGFLIDRSNEQVYIPDDGSIELAGRSRSYGIDSRISVRLNSRLSFNGGLTRVLDAYFPGQFASDGSRLIVDGAPRTTANAGFILTAFKGFDASLNWRHISNYRLDNEDPMIRASGHDVVDLALTRRVRSWLDVNLSVDNLLNKKYFETQNYFESRACQQCKSISRIHATPSYPLTVSGGVTFRFGNKK